MLLSRIGTLLADTRRNLLGESPARAGPAAQTQLARLQGLAPAEACRQLERQMRIIAEAGLADGERLAALVRLHDALSELLARLELSLPRRELRFTAPQIETVHAQLALLKRLARAFAELAESLARPRWLRRPSIDTLQIALQHGALAVVQRLELAHRIYAQGSGNCWRQLFALSACALRLPRHANPGRTPDVLALHARAVLFALADPNRLEPAALDQLRLYLRRHGGLARVHAAERLAGAERGMRGLYALGVGGRPAVPLSACAPGSERLILDARPLIARLERQLAGLASGEDPTRLGLPRDASSAAYRGFLVGLRAHWSHRSARRQSRGRFLPRAKLAFGFEPIRAWLCGAAGAGTSDWQVTDESPAGFGLAQLAGRPPGLAVGALCALRREGQAHTGVGVVRRAVNRAPSDCRLGIELLGGEARAAIVRSTAEPRVESPAILLPRAPALAGAAALLVPAGHWRAPRMIILESDGRALRAEFSEVRALVDGIDLLTLAPVP